MFVQLPVTAFVCATLVLVPIPWHWRAGNISTIAISLWLFVGNIIYGINAIIWGNTVQNIAPVWCDISKPLAACIVFLLILLQRPSLKLAAR